MLPNTPSQLGEFKAVQLVHKQGGYVVYKIPSAQPSNT
jgi:hypothetical protein